MSFLNPIWLWGLTGLAVPIAIHLLSRKEGKVIRIGSLRHLTESTSQQFKSIRLNELLLLALRLLMIILVVLLLSELRIDGNTKEQWVLVEPRLKENAIAQRIADSLTAQGFIAKSWSAGFPHATRPFDNDPINHWQLIEKLQDEPLFEAVVLSPSRLSDFYGEPQALPDHVRWFQIDEPAQNFIQSARQLPSGEVLLRKGSTQSTKTTFVSERIPTETVNDSLEIQPADSIPVFIQADEGFLYDRGILVAAIKSIEQNAEVKIPVHFRSNTVDSVWNFWLSEKPSPVFKGPSITYFEKADGTLIELVSEHRWVLTQHLNIDNAIASHVSLQIATLLLEEKSNSKKKADLRTMPETMRWSRASEKTSSTPARTSIDNWLLLLLVGTFVFERILSNKKRA